MECPSCSTLFCNPSRKFLSEHNMLRALSRESRSPHFFDYVNREHHITSASKAVIECPICLGKGRICPECWESHLSCKCGAF